jgi:hypothetical protein
MNETTCTYTRRDAKGKVTLVEIGWRVKTDSPVGVMLRGSASVKLTDRDGCTETWDAR